MSEWISVKDRLPEEHQTVDIFTTSDGRWVEVEFYNGNFYAAEQDYDVDDDGLGCLNNTLMIELTSVTHWMPLPEPPEDKS